MLGNVPVIFTIREVLDTTKDLVSEEIYDFWLETGVFYYENSTPLLGIKRIDWSASSDEKRVNHMYAWLKSIWIVQTCIKNVDPLSYGGKTNHNKKVPDDFFTNASGIGDFWVAEDINLNCGNNANPVMVNVNSFTIVLQALSNPNASKVNPLSPNLIPPNGNASNLYGIVWPQGESTDSNKEVIGIRANEETIDIISQNLYPCPN